MDSNSSPVEMFFFPFVGGGHQIPMIDMAKIFASHGAAKSTIIATPKHALSFQRSVNRNQQSGLPITIKTLQLPDHVEISDTDMSAPPTDTSILQDPLKALLLDSKPDCIVHDMFHHWAADVINSMNIPRIVFTGNGCFSRCVLDNIMKHESLEKVSSDYEQFVVPSLPDKIELTKSQLPVFIRQGSVPKMFANPGAKSFGIVVNSFYKLEPAYVEHFKQDLGNNKAWLVGPVSLCNRDIEDKTERGQKTTIDEEKILSFLESKESNSVLYISFGSLARLAAEQIPEIAYGLEASNHSFIWVVGKIFQSPGKENGNEENLFPREFEERMRESRKGLIIRGWAPQLLILEHEAVGGFMTHCGWNSTLEGVSAGVPMVTWPITAEQFVNEKLITDVLKIGVRVGSVNWESWSPEPGADAAVGRDKVEMAVKRVMGAAVEAAEMRKRAAELGEKATRAVEEGGSSYIDAEALIQELKSRREIAS